MNRRTLMNVLVAGAAVLSAGAAVAPAFADVYTTPEVPLPLIWPAPTYPMGACVATNGDSCTWPNSRGVAVVQGGGCANGVYLAVAVGDTGRGCNNSFYPGTEGSGSYSVGLLGADSYGDQLAISDTGDAYGRPAIVQGYPQSSAASGTGCARSADVAVGGGCAEGGLIGVAGTGHARGGLLAFSALGPASASCYVTPQTPGWWYSQMCTPAIAASVSGPATATGACPGRLPNGGFVIGFFVWSCAPVVAVSPTSSATSTGQSCTHGGSPGFEAVCASPVIAVTGTNGQATATRGCDTRNSVSTSPAGPPLRTCVPTVAASANNNARGDVASSVTGENAIGDPGWGLGINGYGNASGAVAASGTGDADGRVLAVAPLGNGT